MQQPSYYHLDRTALVAALGVLAVMCGAGVLTAVGVVHLRSQSVLWSVAFWCLLVATALAAALLVVVSLRTLRRTPVLVLDGSGFRIRGWRGSGVRSATWREVADVVTAEGVVRIRLRDGRSATLPIRLVDEPPAVWLPDIRDRLRRTHRARRLR